MHELLPVKATFRHVEVVSDELDGEVMPPDSLEGDGHVHHGSCIIIDLCFVVAGGWDGCFLYKLEVVNSSFSRVKCFLLGCQVLEVTTRDFTQNKNQQHAVRKKPIPAFKA